MCSNCQSLERELEKCKVNMLSAANIGSTYLKKNGELKEELEDLKKKSRKEYEVLFQENYVLKNRLEAKERLEAQYEMDMSKMSHQIEKQQDLNLLQKENSKLSDDLTRARQKVKDLQKELDELVLKNGDLNHRNHLLSMENDKLIRESQKPVESTKSSFNATAESYKLDMECKIAEREFQIDELFRLNATKDKELAELQAEMNEFTSQLHEANHKNENLQNEFDELLRQMAKVTADFTELKLRTGQKNFEAKGNGMYHELDDQRLKVENELLLTTKKLEKAHLDIQSNQKEIKELNMTVQSCLDMQSYGTASSEQVRFLETTINTLRGELRVKNRRLEEMEKLMIDGKDGRRTRNNGARSVSRGRLQPQSNASSDVQHEMIIKLKSNLEESKRDMKTKQVEIERLGDEIKQLAGAKSETEHRCTVLSQDFIKKQRVIDNKENKKKEATAKMHARMDNLKLSPTVSGYVDPSETTPTSPSPLAQSQYATPKETASVEKEEPKAAETKRAAGALRKGNRIVMTGETAKPDLNTSSEECKQQ